MSRRDLPMCAVCGHPVERLEETYDPFMERNEFRAYCHGAVERIVVHDTEAAGMRVWTTAGTAFEGVRRLGA